MNLRPILIQCICSLIVFGLPLQGTTEPTELAKLQDSYQRKLAEAVTPVNHKYVRALRELERKYTKAGNLEFALLVREIRLAESSFEPPKSALFVNDAEKKDSPALESRDEVLSKLSGSRWSLHYEGQGIGERRELGFSAGGKLVVYAAAKGAAKLREREQGEWRVEEGGEVLLNVKGWKHDLRLRVASDLGHFWGFYGEENAWRFGRPVSK